MKNQPYYNLTTTLLPDEKLKNIFDRLNALKPGSIVEVKNPDNIPFIKQYADTHRNITFNNDYTKIKKL
jgi:uncharacterized protein (DUF2249 family)